jgi:hypothetical protein
MSEFGRCPGVWGAYDVRFDDHPDKRQARDDVQDRALRPGSAPRPAPPLTALLRLWPVALVLAGAGAFAGVTYAQGQPTTYTAETRLAVGMGDLSSGAIAGFPEAANQLASNYSRYVNDQGLTGSSDLAAVAASQIPESNVIRIEAVSTDQRAAVAQVARTADDLVDEVNNPRTDLSDLLQTYKEAAANWARTSTQLAGAQAEFNRLQANANATPQRLDRASIRLQAALSDEASARVQKDALGARYQNRVTSSVAADLSVVREASVVSDDRRSRIERYGLLGGVAGIAAALLLAVAWDRRRSRRRATRAS